jgi:peptidoglycan biosynthesis protein MviN/MurJ (putative lipid II flippase)
LIMPLAVVFYPTFAREAAREGRGNLERELRDALRIAVFLALPVTCWMVVHALPLTRVIFERGQFDFTNSTRTAGMLTLYSLGLLPNAVAVILLRAFYAVQDTVTPLLAEAANLACYAWFAPRLAERYGLIGLGAARAGSFVLVAVILLFALSFVLHRIRVLTENRMWLLCAGRNDLGCLFAVDWRFPAAWISGPRADYGISRGLGNQCLHRHLLFAWGAGSKFRA